jgi:hypothetical protein
MPGPTASTTAEKGLIVIKSYHMEYPMIFTVPPNGMVAWTSRQGIISFICYPF